MKYLNILSLSEICNNFKKDEYKAFFDIYGIELKREEVQDLSRLVEKLNGLSDCKKIFDMFFVGYKIPQIGKEFDLLRIGRSSIVNIELKKVSTERKILKQLLRNKNYMNHVEKDVFYYTFESETSKLYNLNSNNELEEVAKNELVDKLGEQELMWTEHPDSLFDPTAYLVSPFNSTGRFLNREYFLTNQQESVKKNIVKRASSLSSKKFFAISGAAGTGKTLLVYDIAADLNINKEVLIVHCANLNDGQKKLNLNGWNIVSIKSFMKKMDGFVSKSDCLIIDEAQRLKKDQLQTVVKAVAKYHVICIFSYDQRQTLSKSEESMNIEQYLKKINANNKFRLTKKIRSNESVANFIMSIFDLSYPERKIKNRDSLELLYFSTHKIAEEYVTSILGDDWKVLGLTPSSYTPDSHNHKYNKYFDKSHSVIGQEFDRVAVVIDEHFAYKGCLLGYRGQSYYSAQKMLFQNMTRARKKLMLIVVSNKRLFSEALQIVSD